MSSLRHFCPVVVSVSEGKIFNRQQMPRLVKQASKQRGTAATEPHDRQRPVLVCVKIP